MELIGREDEVREVVERLGSRRLVTLVGPGGIGKTCLARVAADKVAGRFELGVRWVDLTRVDAADAVRSTVASQLGFASFGELLDSPSERSLLLLIDNCEHVVDAAADAVTAILETATTATVLATSRSPLDVGDESLIVLGPLPVPTADRPAGDVGSMRLFLERARDAGAQLGDDQLDAVAELCRQLDGVPLALEIAAARTRLLSPREILVRLDDRIDVLSRPRFRGAPRHRSVSEAIEWSYRLLDDGTAALFERLGVFAGPFTSEMVHAVAAPAGVDRARSDRMLEALVDASLVVTEQGGSTTGYRLLVTVRRFAFELLSRRGGVEATQDRFVQHVVSQAVATVTAAAGGWDSTMLSRLLGLYEHVAAALRWCLDHDGDGTRSLLLCSLLLGAVDNVHTEEITALARDTLARWPDPQLRFAAEARSTLATGMLVTGAPDAALELAEVTLAGLDDSSYANVTLPRVIGRAANALGDPARAVEAYTVAAQQARGRGNVGLAMEAETFRALALADMGEVDVAVADLERVCAEAASLGSTVNEAWARAAQGSVLVRRDPAAAATVIDEALASSRQIGFSVGIAASLRSLALVHLAAGELERAAQRLVELLDELTAHGRLSDLHLMFDVAAVVLEQAGTPGWEDLAATARSLPVFSTIVGAGRDLFPSAAGAGTVLSRRDAIVLARRQLAAVSDGRRAGPTEPIGAAADVAVLVVRGDYYEIQFAGRTTAVKRSKGLDDLTRLVATPGREIHCLELMGAGVEQPSTGELIDDNARRQYEQRVRDLQAVIDAASADNDYVRADVARVELDAIVDQLTATLGLGGRRRRAGGSAERARSAVTQRLRTTIRRLGEANPALGRHLEASIITGTYCSYKPEHAVTWQT